MRADRAYVKRRQARAERRGARAKRRAREHGVYPSNARYDDVPIRLKRAFQGIDPMSPVQRMEQMERAQDRKMKEVWR